MLSVVANPPRTATKDDSLSSLTGSNPKLVYTIPANTDVSQNIIWAFSDTNPNSADAGASIVQHLNSGPVKLNLGNTLAASSRDPTNPISTLSGSGSTPAPTTGGSVSTPLLNYQKMLVAHGILCVIGFLGILPAGALLARYMRTYSSAWFKGHHLLQLFICEWFISSALSVRSDAVYAAFPIIVAGFALGFAGVHTSGAPASDDHKKWGIAIFVLYVFQLVIGEVIHLVKPKSWTVGKRRPAQNYFHAVLGVLIIALAFYQVRLSTALSMNQSDRYVSSGSQWVQDRVAKVHRTWKRWQRCEHRLVHLGCGKHLRLVVYLH